MVLALNNPQRLICHLAKNNQTYLFSSPFLLFFCFTFFSLPLCFFFVLSSFFSSSASFSLSLLLPLLSHVSFSSLFFSSSSHLLSLSSLFTLLPAPSFSFPLPYTLFSSSSSSPSLSFSIISFSFTSLYSFLLSSFSFHLYPSSSW